MTVESQKLALIQLILALQDTVLMDAILKVVSQYHSKPQSATPLQAPENYIFWQLGLASEKAAHATLDKVEWEANAHAIKSSQENPRQFGCGKGIFSNMAPDFDETPLEFEEYMPASL